ncbi:MAG: hypothetical protein Q9219_006084 [cf. Caloplaca sp. 3 TL-2023]
MTKLKRYQESLSDVDIVVFSELDESEHTDGSIKARADKSLSYSVISTAMLNRVRVNHTLCQKEAVRDSKNRVYSPVGKVDLRWHKKLKGKSHLETFYVVNDTASIVILGAPAFEASSQSATAGDKIYPVGLQQQTPEQKSALERQKQEAAARRALEVQAQERKEAERCQQQSQHK